MTPDEKTNKIVDLALRCARLRRELDAATERCGGCAVCRDREVEGLVEGA